MEGEGGKAFVGVDLGGTYIKFALVSGNIRILQRRKLPTPQEGREAVVSQMERGIREVGKEIAICGIGIGTPGLVDSRKGVVRGFTNIKDWENVPLRDLLEERMDIPVFVDNDVNMMTWGEYRCGGGRGCRDIICLTLGTGVGGGIVINGRLYRGHSMCAGEIGHIPINVRGPRCDCGGIACMERYVGNAYIVERTVGAIRKGKRSIIPELVGRDLSKITPKIITDAADREDDLAREIWEETGTYIGVALAGLVNFLNPERIIIGGGVAKAGEWLFRPLRKTVEKRAMSLPAREVQILPAQLGEDAGVIGAAMSIKDELIGRSR